ncbi:hypothetical protein FNU3_128 [Fusobacterium phage vB_FnuS_FNU3]|uniref:DUF1874 domain-containing protein n=1 Tax=Fusobacterium phage Fnu1 TaxID=2530024 RepID=A0A481W6A8_9CAUD|nr:DUF1874 domain-containing protein [Fusobacterium phage Fnu1]QBJ04180.1 DUF1874 domain-containing protein [Fusobacterium phage Fnu1]WGH50290.1 hypothetical protein FNU2_1 [Fusobacterium phage vB_FnuS_FNU2]WGH50430.1 hypothetical protein FNU3_128 [Fusobacterium phage vB_FnuS_FNU3]
MTIGILNTPILTGEGTYKLSNITLEQAQKLVNENEFISYIGHQATAEIISILLGTEVPMNRGQFKQEVGQKAIIFKLKSRLLEGQILLTIQEIEEIGYEFQLLERKN